MGGCKSRGRASGRISLRSEGDKERESKKECECEESACWEHCQDESRRAETTLFSFKARARWDVVVGKREGGI